MSFWVQRDVTKAKSLKFIFSDEDCIPVSQKTLHTILMVGLQFQADVLGLLGKTPRSLGETQNVCVCAGSIVLIFGLPFHP